MKPVMIRPRWRKLISDLWDNKVRTALVVVSIAIGAFAVGMIAGAYLIISEDLSASYSDANPANIVITTDAFNKDYLSTIERLPGVKEVEARRKINVRFQVNETQWDVVTLVAQPDITNSSINKLLPNAGERIPADKQVVLERKTLEFYGLKVGDILEIELSDGTKKSLPVVGAALDRTIGYGAFMGEKKGYVSADTIEWLRETPYYDQLLITVNGEQDNKDFIESISKVIEDHLEKGGRQVYQSSVALTNKHPLESIITALLGVLFFLGILVAFLSGSLIANTLNALLTQQLGQIGVMKLVGARSRQINWIYILLILAFSGIALSIAIPAGNYAALALSSFAAELLNVVLKPHDAIWPAILVQVIIAFGIPLTAGIFPVRRGSKITVQKAISSTGIDSSASDPFIDRVIKLLKSLSRPLLISLRNTFRKKKRLALTLFNLALGGAIFISVFNVQASLNNKIRQTTDYFQADVNIELEQNYRIEEIRSVCLKIPGVEGIEGWASYGGEILRDDDTVIDNITILGPPSDTKLIVPILLKGRWLLPEDENALVINEAFLDEYPDVLPGEELKIKINGNIETLVVVGIIQFTGMDELYAYAQYDYLANKLNMTSQASSYRVITNDHSSANQEQIRNLIDSRFQEIGIKISDIQAGGTFVDSIVDYISILITFLLIMALLTAVVGSIGLAGTLSMNVMERTREIGVMRAIGAHDRIVIRMVITEGLMISGISYLIGALLSFPITYLLSNIISEAIFNSPADFAFTIQGFIIWLVIAILLSVVASVIPARRATRMTIREVLAYE